MSRAGSGVRADSDAVEQPGCLRGEDRGDAAGKVAGLGEQLLHAAGEQPQGVYHRAGGAPLGRVGELGAAADQGSGRKPGQASRSAGSALTRTALSWLIAWVRALTAESRTSLNTRTICTGPSTVVGVTSAWYCNGS